MLAAYAKEKQAIVEKYVRLKPWYTGELQRTIQNSQVYDFTSGEDGEYVDRENDQMPDRSSWSGLTFWESCLNGELKTLHQQYEQYFASGDSKPYMWVGIRPDIVDYPTLKSLYDRLLQLKGYSYYAVVEANAKEGYGPHIHMMLFTKSKPHRIRENFSKFFKCAQNFIEAKNFKTLYEQRLNYLKGIKTDEKDIYVKKDREERKLYNIPDFIDCTQK